MAKKEEIKWVEEFGIWERGASEGTNARDTFSKNKQNLSLTFQT